jgi:hypothetical protein
VTISEPIKRTEFNKVAYYIKHAQSYINVNVFGFLYTVAHIVDEPQWSSKPTNVKLEIKREPIKKEPVRVRKNFPETWLWTDIKLK